MMARTFPTRRSGFTLVEILVVLTVIGILVGMLAAGVIPAMKRANEFAIQTEMSQLEVAIEQFKVKYGFYPPSFVRIQFPADLNGDGNNDVIDSKLTLLSYLNRISPNHQMLNDDVDTSDPNDTWLDTWWDNIGQFINHDQGEDLTFWLTGISKNKQFPFPVNPADARIEFDQFFEFRAGQSMDLDGDGINSYLQPKGKEVPYLYIDNSSYGWGPSLDPSDHAGITEPVFFDGYTNDFRDGSTPIPGRFNGNTFIPGTYENPSSFQLVTAGMDGDAGAPYLPPNDVNGVSIANFTTDWQDFTGPTAADNLCSFAGGRLERMQLGTAGN